MRPLLIDVESPPFEMAAESVEAGSAQLLNVYAKRSVSPRVGRIVLVGKGAEGKKAYGKFQKALQQFGISAAGRSGAAADVGGDDHASTLQFEAIEEMPSVAAGTDKAAPFHGGLFLSSSSERCRQAADAGLVPYFVPPDASEPLLNKMADALSDHVRFESCHKKLKAGPSSIASSAKASVSKDDRIQQLLSKVDTGRLKASLQALQDFGTRWSYGSNMSQVTEAIHDNFIDAAYPAAEVQYQAFTVPQAPPQRNVICGKPLATAKYILICAHYDSFSQLPQTLAPGCDDNASGVAALLETARVLRNVSLARPVVYAAFGGEEQGLFGSRHCAKVAAAGGWKIDVMINLDMVGFQSNPSEPSIVVEYDQGNQVASNDALAKEFGLQMAQVAKDYTSLRVTHTDIWNSDYMPFEAEGYPCIGLYDGATEQTFYHTTQDTIDNIDIAALQNVTQLLVATVAQISKFT